MEILLGIIDFLGPSNVLAIILFVISVFIAFYLYYRSFFRLVYSTGRICKTCSNIQDWQNNENEFVSRIVIIGKNWSQHIYRQAGWFLETNWMSGLDTLKLSGLKMLKN